MLVLIAALGSGFWYVADNRGWLDKFPTMVVPTQLSQVTSQLASLSSKVSIPQLPAGSSNDIAVLSSRLATVSGEVGEVLGSSIKTSEGGTSSSQPPLHERAFERARYVYCQEAVRDYDARYGSPD